MMSDRLPNRANRGVDLGVFVLATLPQKERAPRPASQPVPGSHIRVLLVPPGDHAPEQRDS
jgi:hypothetical protein